MNNPPYTWDQNLLDPHYALFDSRSCVKNQNWPPLPLPTQGLGMLDTQDSQYEVVILAGGECKRLYPLTSGGVVKALLPVGNRPLVWYPLRHLAEAGIKNAIVVRTLHKHIQVVLRCCGPGTAASGKQHVALSLYCAADPDACPLDHLRDNSATCAVVVSYTIDTPCA